MYCDFVKQLVAVVPQSYV